MVSCIQKYCISQYVLIHTMIYIYTRIYHVICLCTTIYCGYKCIYWYEILRKCLVNLRIEGMKAPLKHIKWITFGAHCTPALLGILFHAPKGCQGSVHDMCLQDMIPLCWSPTGTGFRPPISFVGKPQLILQGLPIHSASFMGSHEACLV
jgi:hypothetical protein